jgi:hypothetical protein
MSRFNAAGLIAALNGDTGEDADGWIKTVDILPLIGVTSLAGSRPILARLVRCGFAKEKRLNLVRLVYQLSPKFKTWGEAHTESLLVERFKAPRGWVTITQYARKHRRTARGVQYRIDGSGIDWKVYKTPRPVPHYRESDLDRIIRKAS